MYSKIFLGNNTSADLRDFPTLNDHLREFGDVPEELADIFAVKLIEVADGKRFILNWA